MPLRWRPTSVPGVAIRGRAGVRDADVLTTEALAFVAELDRRFAAQGNEPASDHEPLAPTEDALQERRIEIAAGGVLLVDFRAKEAQSWAQRIARLVESKNGSAAALSILRPRNWRATEEHLSVDGQPVCAALFDVGLYVFHRTAAAPGTALHCDLSHVQAALDARLWSEVFQFVEQALGLSTGTIKVALVTSPPRV